MPGVSSSLKAYSFPALYMVYILFAIILHSFHVFNFLLTLFACLLLRSFVLPFVGRLCSELESCLTSVSFFYEKEILENSWEWGNKIAKWGSFHFNSGIFDLWNESKIGVVHNMSFLLNVVVSSRQFSRGMKTANRNVTSFSFI